MPDGIASYGTLSVVGTEVWFVGGNDHRVDLTGRDTAFRSRTSE